MLLMLTVSNWDTILMENVALNNGSSQQGKAARASMG
jgi:hypothetical protein